MKSNKIILVLMLSFTSLCSCKKDNKVYLQTIDKSYTPHMRVNITKNHVTMNDKIGDIETSSLVNHLTSTEENELRDYYNQVATTGFDEVAPIFVTDAYSTIQIVFIDEKLNTVHISFSFELPYFTISGIGTDLYYANINQFDLYDEFKFKAISIYDMKTDSDKTTTTDFKEYK